MPLYTTPPLRAGTRVHYDILEWDPLLDSSECLNDFYGLLIYLVSVSDWKKLAYNIELSYDNYDGFVIVHGTDTMAYSARFCVFFFMI